MKRILSLLLALLLIFSSITSISIFNVSAAEIPGNLLSNGDFETDTGYLQDSILNRFPSPMGASPVWNTTAQFHKWFRATNGTASINSRIIADPANANNKIARIMQTALQGVTITASNTYELTFSAKSDFAFQQFHISFVDVSNAGTNSVHPILYPISAVTGTKTYDNNGTQVVQNITPYYAPGTRVQMALDTDKWVTYKLLISVGTTANPTHLCALRFSCEDYSSTPGDPGNAPYYLDNVSLVAPLVINSTVETVNGKVGGYLTTPNSIGATVGQSITLKAVPFTGNTFLGWYLNDVQVSTDAEYTFTASAAASYVAKFSISTSVYIPPSVITPDDIIADDVNLMISYPHYGTPVFTEPGKQFNAEVRAPESYGTSGWTAWVENEYQKWDCTVGTVTYGTTNIYLGMKAGYVIPITLPANITPELCTLVLQHGADAELRSPLSVSIVPKLDSNFYTGGVTDTHFGWNLDNTLSGTQSPTAWGLLTQVMTLGGARFLSHTGDTVLDTTISRKQGLKDMLIGKQLQYSGSRMPLIWTPGNHENDVYTAPQASITEGTILGDFSTDDQDRFFGMRSQVIKMGSFAVAKHDYRGYFGDFPLRDALAAKWNSLTGISYRMLLQHTHIYTGTPFQAAQMTTYPNLELKGHDHSWTVNETNPFLILSLGGGGEGGWTGGSGTMFNFNYDSGNWACPQATPSFGQSNKMVFINDGRIASAQTKLRDTYQTPNNGMATANTCTVTNEVNFNFFDGRVRFVMAPGNHTVTNGTKLSQYNSADGSKTIVLARVNIPASSNITVSIAKSTDPVITRTVTFDSQGGSAVTSQTCETNMSIFAPSNPTKSGSTFTGWYTAASGGSKITFPYTVTGDITLYAQWTVAGNFVITFDSGGGSVVTAQTAAQGTTISAPANPTKANATFDGWYTAASGGTKIIFPYTVTGNATLYARWNSTAGNLIINGNFETDTGFTQENISNRFPSPLYITNPAWTTFEQYHKWFRASGGNKDIYSNIITDPASVNNKIARVMQTGLQGVAVEGGKTYIIKFNAKADFAFQKFVISFSDLTNASTNPIHPILFPITSAIGTKTYDNGGTPVVENITPYEAAGTRIVLPLETNKWATYEIKITLGTADQTKLCALRFACDDYSGTAGDPATAPFYLDNVSLEEFVPYTATFDSNGGSTVASQSVIAGTVIAAPATPTKSGFIFDGWYTDLAGSTKVTFPYTVTGNVTLYAHWTSTGHTPGDINNDGLVDLVDITILSRYVAGWTGLNYNEDALNVNGDSTVDLLDITILSRFVAGWSVTIY